MNGDQWIQRVRGFGVAAVAPELGLAERRSDSLAPCPVCFAEARSSSEPNGRGPIGLRRDGAGWQCHRCKASGDAVNLVAARLLGRVKCESADDWRAVRAWCAERGLCDGGAAGAAPAKLRPLPAPRPPAPPVRPPQAEVRALWNRSRSVADDAAVAAWLRARNIAPELIEHRGGLYFLARALPEGALPAWARFKGKPWSESGHRLLVALYDARAELVSVQARLILADAPKGVSKSGNPAPVLDEAATRAAGEPVLTRFELRGLVMADTLGLRLLRGEAPRSGRVVVAEGVPDFLTAATEPFDAATAPAVLGIVAGAWSKDIAERIPKGARVGITTHRDDADGTGDRFAAQIAATLAGREVLRWNPKTKGAG